MAYHLRALDDLIDHFRRLPGIGGKSAQRLALHVMQMPKEQAQSFAEAVLRAKTSITYCEVCQNFSDKPVCSVCSNEKRDHSVVCVVESPADVLAIEKTGDFGAVYHVLHGVISPMERIGPDDIKLRELLTRISVGEIKEVIIATNPTVEGDATAMYIAKLLKPFDVRVSRLAFGIPVGGDLEYADTVTLAKAIENRRDM